jgi:hypothetical protein
MDQAALKAGIIVKLSDSTHLTQFRPQPLESSHQNFPSQIFWIGSLETELFLDHIGYPYRYHH